METHTHASDLPEEIWVHVGDLLDLRDICSISIAWLMRFPYQWLSRLSGTLKDLVSFMDMLRSREICYRGISQLVIRSPVKGLCLNILPIPRCNHIIVSGPIESGHWSVRQPDVTSDSFEITSQGHVPVRIDFTTDYSNIRNWGVPDYSLSFPHITISGIEVVDHRNYSGCTSQIAQSVTRKPNSLVTPDHTSVLYFHQVTLRRRANIIPDEDNPNSHDIPFYPTRLTYLQLRHLDISESRYEFYGTRSTMTMIEATKETQDVAIVDVCTCPHSISGPTLDAALMIADNVEAGPTILFLANSYDRCVGNGFCLSEHNLSLATRLRELYSAEKHREMCELVATELGTAMNTVTRLGV